MSELWRLIWALPLVLAIGVTAMMILRRFMVPVARPDRAVRRMDVRQTLALSEHTRVHLIEIDGSGYVVVESTQQATLQSLSLQARPASPKRFAPAWLRHVAGATR